MPQLSAGEFSESDESLKSIADGVRDSIKTVEDRAQAFIREAIQQGVFPPGHRLNLESIAAALGVSRMPVRAGLRQLESEGLLKIHPHRGATVVVLSAKEIGEIYDIRVLLEGYLIEKAIANLDDDVMAELAVLEKQLDHAPDAASRLDARKNFYRRLYEAADRPKALQLVDQLRVSVGRYLLLQRIDEHAGHDDFMDALTRRDAVAARAWLSAHLGRVSVAMQEMVAEAEQVTGS